MDPDLEGPKSRGSGGSGTMSSRYNPDWQYWSPGWLCRWLHRQHPSLVTLLLLPDPWYKKNIYKKKYFLTLSRWAHPSLVTLLLLPDPWYKKNIYKKKYFLTLSRWALGQPSTIEMISAQNCLKEKILFIKTNLYKFYFSVRNSAKAKNPPKKKKIWRNLMFWKCWIFSLEGCKFVDPQLSGFRSKKAASWLPKKEEIIWIWLFSRKLEASFGANPLHRGNRINNLEFFQLFIFFKLWVLNKNGLRYSKNPGSGFSKSWFRIQIPWIRIAEYSNTTIQERTLCPHLRKEFFLLGSSFTTFVSPPQFSELKTNFLKGQ